MRTLQLPLYHFLFPDDEKSGCGICIDRLYVSRTGMFVPHLSVPVSAATSGIDLPFINERGRVPYAGCLPSPAPVYGDGRELVETRRRSKMQWWRTALPDCSIRTKYLAVERYEIRGYTSIKAIESDAVIRELRMLCERGG